ncbi:MAG: UvrD-helicase domain-containing protein, partial [Clostridia bacterium]|nr:UvrD-helicase domain-containing protein [Clostridia bacterium]
MSRKYTPNQQNAIDFPVGNAPMQNMLVSASAGTGKTTVMIERIARLVRESVNVDQIVVVTFTNLAAAQMKNRLLTKLAEYSDDLRAREQLERLDNASICTLHSFCSDLLRNYFYVVDIDPAFSILDAVTVANLKKSAIDDMFRDYFVANDADFLKLYQIYSTNRQEENFKDLIVKLHVFSRNVVDFEGWYKQKRDTFTAHDNGGFVMNILLNDIVSTVTYCKEQYLKLIERCKAEGGEQIAQCCQASINAIDAINWTDIQSAFDGLAKVKLESLLPTNRKAYIPMADALIEDKIRSDYTQISKMFKDKAKLYTTFLAGKSVATMWQEMDDSLAIADKLVEMVVNFENRFFALKKQRGGVDFNDLEHLTLKVLADPEVSAAIHQKYKYVFVDEYQDTNPIQEEIITRIVNADHLFMVGDIKQSIYGFRGCDPGIFGAKQRGYAQSEGGVLEQLNDNFRSNKDILQFVNFVFSQIMTEELGQVDYKNSACFKGETPQILKQVPSVRINFLQKAKADEQIITDYYDITKPTEAASDELQAMAIANRIKSYVGMAYKDKHGTPKRIQYGDIVILMRGMTDKTTQIFDALVAENIPVTAAFKLDGFASKEVRELINLLRVIDNPYNDVHLVGVCLCAFGGFTETELAKVRLNTTKEIVPFFERLVEYKQHNTDDVSAKIAQLLQLVDDLRFY